VTNMYSFDAYSGFLIPPYLTFPQAPCDPGQSDLPNPVLTVAFPLMAFLSEVRLKCWIIYTPPSEGLPVRLGSSLMD
jgi:hypothetical protein